MDEVLVVVPTLGTRPAWLEEALRSISSQEGASPLIRIVCPPNAVRSDDLCIDGVEIIESDSRGLSAAIAAGFEGYTGEFVTWLGDDDRLQPGSLRDVIGVMRANPGASFAYGRTRYISADGRTIGVTRPGRLAARYLTFGKDFVPQPGSILRREAVEIAGGINLHLKNAMDLDLFIRLRKVGRSVYLPREVSCYRLHDSSITLTKGSEDEGESVRRQYLSKRMILLYPLWRPVTRVVDRIWDIANRHLPAPAEPK